MPVRPWKRDRLDLEVWCVFFTAAQLVVLVAGCSGGSAASSEVSSTQAVIESNDVTLADASRCPVTIPNGEGPPGEVRSATYHGEAGLFTALPEDGIIVAKPQDLQPDGTIAIKFPWWAAGPEGSLSISGKRLDVSAPDLRAEITPSMPDTPFRGTGFWATSVIFSTEGCWEVSGTVEDAALRFVTFVVKA